MHVLKVRKIGNSLGVLLPKSYLEANHVHEGDTLTGVDTAGSILSLSPNNPDFAHDVELGERMIHRYRDMLAALAKR